MDSKRRNKIIGVIGLPGVGKSTFINILVDKLLSRGLAIYRCKMSDWMYAKVAALDLILIKENMIWLSNTLKRKYGVNYWVHVIYNDLSTIRNEYDITFIETGWSFEELIILKERLRGMILVALTAPIEIIIKRITQREKHTEKELQDVIYVMKHSKIEKFIDQCGVIISNSSTLNHLHQECEKFLKQYF